jgi:hypothetical protein
MVSHKSDKFKQVRTRAARWAGQRGLTTTKNQGEQGEQEQQQEDADTG